MLGRSVPALIAALSRHYLRQLFTGNGLVDYKEKEENGGEAESRPPVPSALSW